MSELVITEVMKVGDNLEVEVKSMQRTIAIRISWLTGGRYWGWVIKVSQSGKASSFRRLVSVEAKAMQRSHMATLCDIRSFYASLKVIKTVMLRLRRRMKVVGLNLLSSLYLSVQLIFQVLALLLT